MPESCPAWLATGLSAIHPCDQPPKIVQTFTIGEISSTKPQGNSLDRAFYDGLRLASISAIRIHAGTPRGTDEDQGKLGRHGRGTCARPRRCAGDRWD